mmetsp:Transcript_20424/g.40823  ORF Transcript_20424/g.40823 Transcript_20424/m.40823 type:complete len:282 (-) Transcript_20424:170-1015(-)
MSLLVTDFLLIKFLFLEVLVSMSSCETEMLPHFRTERRPNLDPLRRRLLSLESLMGASSSTPTTALTAFSPPFLPPCRLKVSWSFSSDILLSRRAEMAFLRRRIMPMLPFSGLWAATRKAGGASFISSKEARGWRWVSARESAPRSTSSFGASSSPSSDTFSSWDLLWWDTLRARARLPAEKASDGERCCRRREGVASSSSVTMTGRGGDDGTVFASSGKLSTQEKEIDDAAGKEVLLNARSTAARMRRSSSTEGLADSSSDWDTGSGATSAESMVQDVTA